MNRYREEKLMTRIVQNFIKEILFFQVILQLCFESEKKKGKKI